MSARQARTVPVMAAQEERRQGGNGELHLAERRTWTMRPVSQRVGNVKNNDPSLIEALELN